jgi:hypothetical protein
MASAGASPRRSKKASNRATTIWLSHECGKEQTITMGRFGGCGLLHNPNTAGAEPGFSILYWGYQSGTAWRGAGGRLKSVHHSCFSERDTVSGRSDRLAFGRQGGGKGTSSGPRRPHSFFRSLSSDSGLRASRFPDHLDTRPFQPE